MFRCSEKFTSGDDVQSFRSQMNVFSGPVSNFMGCKPFGLWYKPAGLVQEMEQFYIHFH